MDFSSIEKENAETIAQNEHRIALGNACRSLWEEAFLLKKYTSHSKTVIQ